MVWMSSWRLFEGLWAALQHPRHAGRCLPFSDQHLSRQTREVQDHHHGTLYQIHGGNGESACWFHAYRQVPCAIQDVAIWHMLAHCKLTNLFGEGCFGDLDFIQAQECICSPPVNAEYAQQEQDHSMISCFPVWGRWAVCLQSFSIACQFIREKAPPARTGCHREEMPWPGREEDKERGCASEKETSQGSNSWENQESRWTLQKRSSCWQASATLQEEDTQSPCCESWAAVPQADPGAKVAAAQDHTEVRSASFKLEAVSEGVPQCSRRACGWCSRGGCGRCADHSSRFQLCIHQNRNDCWSDVRRWLLPWGSHCREVWFTWNYQLHGEKRHQRRHIQMARHSGWNWCEHETRVCLWLCHANNKWTSVDSVKPRSCEGETGLFLEPVLLDRWWGGGGGIPGHHFYFLLR